MWYNKNLSSKKKLNRRMFSMRIGLENIRFDVYISILMMHEKPFTYRVLH